MERFKPEHVLERISNARSVSPEGGVSFSGFAIYEQAPVLQSMLVFPEVARDLDHASLIWRALSKTRPDITKDAFLRELNLALSAQLSQRNERFRLIASISMDPRGLPSLIRIGDSRIEFYGYEAPKKFRASRDEVIKKNSQLEDVVAPSKRYCSVGVEVLAKSPDSAANKALRRLDVLRAIWCLQGNPGMQFSLGGSEFRPINVIRLGSCHTLHTPVGDSATTGMWYEPVYKEAKPFAFKDLDTVLNNTGFAIRGLRSASYGDKIADALVRYVRAFDESDPNTAFVKLWTALEMIVSPGYAEYDKLVERCSFLYQDGVYHRQVLNHLREFRNRNLHAGEVADQAKTNCFFLQGYFQEMVWFLLRNAKFFTSLGEAHDFLSLPTDLKVLTRRGRLLSKAKRFVIPES
jgi:hypothetical protein